MNEEESFFKTKYFAISLIAVILIAIAITVVIVQYSWEMFCQEQYDEATMMYQAYFTGEYVPEGKDGVIDRKMTMKDVESVWSQYNDSGCDNYKKLQFVFASELSFSNQTDVT